jgi:hypothetical protein
VELTCKEKAAITIKMMVAKKKEKIKLAAIKDNEINNYAHYMEHRKNRGRGGW